MRRKLRDPLGLPVLGCTRSLGSYFIQSDKLLKGFHQGSDVLGFKDHCRSVEQGRKQRGELGCCSGQLKIDGILGKNSGSGDGATWMVGSRYVLEVESEVFTKWFGCGDRKESREPSGF